MSNFERTVDLELTGNTRQDFYTLIETINPTVTVTDDETVTVQNNKLMAGYGVPRWKKYTKTYDEFSISANSYKLTIATVPAGSWVHHVAAKHSEAFSGGTITAVKCDVGTADEGTEFLADLDVFQAVSGTACKGGSPLRPLQTFEGGGTDIAVTIRSEGGTLDSLVAGEITVWVCYSQLM